MTPDLGVRTRNPNKAYLSYRMQPTSMAPKSAFVSGLAIISAAVAIFLFCSDLIGLISYINLTDSAAYRMALQQLEAFGPDANSMLSSSTWILTTSIISLAMNAASVIASIGLFRRRKWGWFSYILLIWLQAIYYLVSSAVGYYLARSFAEKSGIGQLLNSSAMFAASGYALVFGAAIAIAVAAVVTWKLSSRDVRSEFV